MGSEVKENDGRASRKLLFRRIGSVTGFFAVLLLILHVLGFSPSHRRGRRQKRWQQEEQSRRRRQGGGEGDDDNFLFGRREATEEDIQQVLSGKLQLVELTVSPSFGADESGKSYSGNVWGHFCPLAWEEYKRDPSAVPMFRDLLAKSPPCRGRGRVTLDVPDIVTRARAHDEATGANVLAPSGFVFHESRCGSTLVANCLTAKDAATIRVYSESHPPLNAMKACGEPTDPAAHCSIDTAAALLRDVVYLMGRQSTPQDEEDLFFKVQSSGSRYIAVMRRAFPTTPWIFVYRDPVQVLMSHLSDAQDRPERVAQLNCVRPRFRNEQPHAVQQVLKDASRSLSSLSNIEYCAVHLAAISESAVRELAISDTGRAVHYKTLPDALVEFVFPQHFFPHRPPLTEAETDRIYAISGKYSKGRAGQARTWEDDSDKKERAAFPEVQAAAEAFLEHSFEQLEEQEASGTMA